MVDFVHLRSEAYTEDSRVPDAQFAPPAEDAMRRDMTINALFYNLHTREVEDFTGRGLDDLASGLVRTPLEPLQTFLDDPLRVLRVIRFACEFGFALDPAIDETVRNNPAIRDAMARKVSRERVGIEVKKMLAGADPARALSLLAEFQLLDIVFHHGGDEASHGEAQAAAVALKELFTWTPELVERGQDYVRHLQSARLAMDRHKITFMEATAAILAPFFVSRGYVQSLRPALETVVASAASGEDAHWLQHVDEAMLIETALRFRKESGHSLAAFPREDLIELLKSNVKWSKPVAKRVTHILEAVIAFPSSLHTDTVAQNHLQLFLWSRKFHNALSPAIAMLLAELPEGDRERLVTALDAIANRFTQTQLSQQPTPSSESGRSRPPKRRVDGRIVHQRLGGSVGPQIAAALDVLDAFEFVYPSATLDQELAFLDQLHLLLK
jgi:tRNA nucleotidyltransferase/poly(A) polymerase